MGAEKIRACFGAALSRSMEGISVRMVGRKLTYKRSSDLHLHPEEGLKNKNVTFPRTINAFSDGNLPHRVWIHLTVHGKAQSMTHKSGDLLWHTEVCQV